MTWLIQPESKLVWVTLDHSWWGAASYKYVTADKVFRVLNRGGLTFQMGNEDQTHTVPRGERQFMMADILDIIYRAHSHCQVPCHPSF